PSYLPGNQRAGGYITDEALAVLLERVLKDKPTVVGLDVFRDTPIGAGFDHLVRVLQGPSRVVLSEFTGIGGGGEPTPVNEGLRGALGGGSENVGVADFQDDCGTGLDPTRRRDCIVRRAFMYLRHEERGIIYSLPYLVAGYYLSAQPPSGESYTASGD